MPRIVIAGSQPQHLSTAQAHAWLRSQLDALQALPAVNMVVLTQVRATSRLPRTWSWMCELHFTHDADALAGAEHPLCVEWLMDLRLLGMHPTVGLLGDGERVR